MYGELPPSKVSESHFGHSNRPVQRISYSSHCQTKPFDHNFAKLHAASKRDDFCDAVAESIDSFCDHCCERSLDLFCRKTRTSVADIQEILRVKRVHDLVKTNAPGAACAVALRDPPVVGAAEQPATVPRLAPPAADKGSAHAASSAAVASWPRVPTDIGRAYGSDGGRGAGCVSGTFTGTFTGSFTGTFSSSSGCCGGGGGGGGGGNGGGSDISRQPDSIGAGVAAMPTTKATTPPTITTMPAPVPNARAGPRKSKGKGKLPDSSSDKAAAKGKGKSRAPSPFNRYRGMKIMPEVGDSVRVRWNSEQSMSANSEVGTVRALDRQPAKPLAKRSKGGAGAATAAGELAAVYTFNFREGLRDYNGTQFKLQPRG
jgi:hypothetical protein